MVIMVSFIEKEISRQYQAKESPSFGLVPELLGLSSALSG
jgi:hypothetical protein